MHTSPNPADRNASPTALPEFLRDFGWKVESRLQSRWVTVDGLRVHSRSSESGEGIPFVLVHGLVVSSLYMIPLAERLAISHPVHAIDLPGFGRSSGPRRALSIPDLAGSLASWMSASGIARAHLVGNSMGCQVIAHVAAELPERVATVTMIGATIDPAAHRISSQFVRLLRDAIHEPARLWADWTVDFLRAGPRRAFGTVRQMFRDRISKQLPHIYAPTLVIRGGKDPTMPQSWSEQANSLLPRSSCAVIDDEAHCAHYTVPHTVEALISRHAAASSPASRQP